MDDSALIDEICVSKQEHINSIVQHHFREVLLGNCTEGGIFLSTKVREKLSPAQLQRVFKNGKVPHIAILRASSGEGSKSGGNSDGEETQKQIRFFSFEKDAEQWEEVFFKTSTEIEEDRGSKTLLQAVFAYSKSVDLYFKTSLYDRIFNRQADEEDAVGRDRARRESLEETESKVEKKKMRHKSSSDTASFGKYLIKPRPNQEIVNILPPDAMSTFDVGMNVSTTSKQFSEAGGYESNLTLETVSKVPVKKKGKQVSANLLYDPHERCEDVGELLCLKVGMEVMKEKPMPSKAKIEDFSRGEIITIGGFFPNITERVLEDSKGAESTIKVILEKKKGRKTEYTYVPLTTLTKIVVKRNPKESARIRNEQKTKGVGARAKQTVRKARKKLREQDVYGLVGEDSPAKEQVLEDPKVLPGEDIAFRYINDLPKVLLPYTPATLLENVPAKFECNICDDLITPIGMLDDDGKKEQTEMVKRILSRRMLKCIAEDRRCEEQMEMARMASLPDEERAKEERGRGNIKAKIIKSLVEHCDTCHVGKIQHHFAPPKMKTCFWAWEMTVGYVAQVLLESSLLQLGLDKGLFEQFLHSGDSAPLCSQLGVIVGGALMITTNNMFNGKLIGYKYNGLYLPSELDLDSIPAPKLLLDMRKVALVEVERRAKEWIKKSLLLEMIGFDHSTLVAALINAGIPAEHRAGYIWNAFGLFFRRGVYACADMFPPAQNALGCKDQLEYSMWDALEAGFGRNRSVVGLDRVTESVAL